MRQELVNERGRKLLDHCEAKLREPFLEWLQKLRQQVRPKCRNDAEAKLSSQGIGVPESNVANGVNLLQNHPGMCHNLVPDRREPNATGIALDKLHTQIVFELFQLRAEGWLRHKTLGGRFAEMPGIGQSNQVAELRERDRGQVHRQSQ